MRSLRSILGTPTFHVFTGCVFALLFVWPFVAFQRPVTVFCFLMGVWGLSIVSAFLLSKGQEEPAEDGAGDDDSGADADV